MSDENDWLGDLPGVKDIQDAAGITYPRRARLRVEGATVVDDPVSKCTVLRIPDPSDATEIPGFTLLANPTAASALPLATPIDEIASVNAANVAALRAANPRTAKLATINDVGGGQFYWDAASTDADDGALTLLPTGWSGAGRWKRLVKDATYDATWFGAQGNDSTDNAAAFSAALSALPADGGTLFLPAGVYRCSASITIPTGKTVRIVGQGPDVTVIRGPGTTAHGLNVGAGNTHIEGVGFDGWQHAILYSDLGGVSDVAIVDCKFSGNSGRAVSANSSAVPISNLRIERCHVSGHTGSNAVGGFIIGSATCSNVVIRGNTIENLSSETGGISGITVGANVGDGSDITDIEVSGNLIRNIDAAGEAHAILCYGHRVLVTNNRIDTVETSSGDCEAIYTKARMGTISGNTIRNGGSASGGAIQIKGSPRAGGDTPHGYTMRVLGNTIIDDRTGANAYGISVHCGELDISHNVIEGCEGAGVYLAPPHSEHVSVTDNELIGIRAPAAIEIRNSKRYVTIKDNRIHSQASGEAIRVLIATNVDTASDITIEGNKVYGFASGRGITLTPQVGRIERVTIMGNTLDVPGPFGAVQIDGAHVASVYDIVCINNRYLNVGPSANLALTQSSIPGAFPILRDNVPFDRMSFFGAPPVTQPDITGGTEEEQIDSIKSALATLGLARDLTWVPTRAGAKSWLYGSNPGVTLETSTDPHQFQEVPDAGAIGGSFEQLDTDHQPKVSMLWTPSPVLLFDGDQFLAHTESADKFTFLHHDGVHEALSGIRFRLTATTGNSRFLFGTRSTASRGFFVFVANNGQLTASFHDGSAQQNFSTGSGAIALNTDYSLVCRKTQTSFSMWLNNTHLLTQDFAAVSPSTEDPQFTLHVGASAGGGIPMVGLVSDLVLFASTDADELPSHSVLRAYLDLQKYTPAP